MSGRSARKLRRELGTRELRRAAGICVGGWTPLALVSSDERGEVFENNLYTVTRMKPDYVSGGRVEDLDGPLWLVVRRRDNSAVRSWSDLQRVKNELAGPDREAVELFPAEGRLVDLGPNYHLHVLAAGQRFALGSLSGRWASPAAEVA
jgi:hypothetical protein